MSKQDRQGARTVAELDRRYNVREAMGAASSSLKASEEARTAATDASAAASEAKNAVGDKVSKTDYDTVVDMINASNAIVRLLAGRLVIESDNFTLSKEGSVVAKDITLKSGNAAGDYSVEIADGVVKVHSPIKIQGEGAIQKIDLMHFEIAGYGMYTLYVSVGLGSDGIWFLNELNIAPVEAEG